MPSLQEQLRSLQGPISKSLGPEKFVDSLLFERKEAAAFTSEEFFNLGVAGLEKLRKLDRSLADSEQDLFHPSKVSFNRTTISANENQVLDQKIRRLLVHICPYFHHQSCRQVLEWLIHKYQVHHHNADLIVNLFLLYHSTNSFGRLFRLLNLTKKEWAFASDFALKGLPMPFDVLIKACVKSGAVMLSNLSSALQEAVTLAGPEYVEEKMQVHFTFFASLVVHMFADPANATNELISRVMPYVGIALKSRMLPYRTAGYMIVCDLCMNVTFSEEIVTNVLKLVMTKVKPNWFEIAMNTVFVITQYQQLTEFPSKTLTNLLRRGEELGLTDFLASAMKNVDLSAFVTALCNTVCPMLASKTLDEQTTDLFCTYLEILIDLESMNSAQAQGFLTAIVTHFEQDGQFKVPERICPIVKNVAIRFSEVFDRMRAEHHLTGSQTMVKLMEHCKIAEHEVGVLDFTDQSKKRRRRRSSCRAVDEDPTLPTEFGRKAKISKEDQLAALKDGAEVKARFKKPIFVIVDMLAAEPVDVDKVKWALEPLQDQKYLAKQSTDDMTKFVWSAILFVAKNQGTPLKTPLKLSLLKFESVEDLFLRLLSQQDSKIKKPKVRPNPLDQALEKEQEDEAESRIAFTLEVLLASISAKPTEGIIRRLFALVMATQNPDQPTEAFKNAVQIQQLCFAYLSKALRSTGVIDLIERECQAEILVSVIRTSHDPQVIRSALQILTAMAPKMPAKLTSQVMSLFTFMGDGLLRRDNELTLRVVEEAMGALVGAVLARLAARTGQMRRQLVEVSAIFSKALPDIPVHRRLRVLRVLARAVHPADLWVVFAVVYQDFCVRWQKGHHRHWAEELDNLCLDLVASLPPEQQIRVAIDLLSYVVGLPGDHGKAGGPPDCGQPVIFDHAAHPLRKLRHFRYIIIGFVVKAVNQEALFEQLAGLTDDEIYKRTSEVGMHMLEVLSSLDDFVFDELNAAEAQEQKSRGTASAPQDLQALKYWIALSARAEVIADKLRCTLPANVSGHIICDLLENPAIEAKMRDRALQLLNVKLLNETTHQAETSTQFDHYLIKFASILNQWIKPAFKNEDVNLCQNAAFSLKLLAKRVKKLPDCSSTFTNTLNRCCSLVSLRCKLHDIESFQLKKWDSFDEAMIGNILLLVAEIVRSCGISSSVLENVDVISQSCLAILNKCMAAEVDFVQKPDDLKSSALNAALQRRRRHRAHSMSGKQLGAEVIFVCALTLLLRLLEFEATGTQSYHEDFLVVYAQLSPKYMPLEERLKELNEDEPSPSDSASHKVSNLKHRLQQIFSAFASLPIPKLQESMSSALKKVHTEAEPSGFLALLLEQMVHNASEAKNITTLSVEVLPMVFELLEIRRRIPLEESRLQAVELAEVATTRAFIALAENLSEVELNPVFGELADWVEEAINAPQHDLPLKLRTLTVYNLANKFFDVFNTLALPYFNQLFAYASRLLKGLNVCKTDSADLFLDGSEKGSLQATMAHELIVSVLSFVNCCAKHRIFMGEDRAQLVYEAVLDELENRKLRGHEHRCTKYLAECVYHLSETSPDLFHSALCLKLLERLRHANARVRHRALLVFDYLANRAGDALAPLLPTVVQHLTEAMEDSDQKVAEQCDRTIRMLKSGFGEDILRN